MDEKAIRSLIEHGGVKQLRIIADGAIFHADIVTIKQGAITALTAKGSVKTWATLDAVARWVRALGIGKVQLDLTRWQSQQKRLVL